MELLRKEAVEWWHMGKSLAHHEYARLFPMLSDEDIQELADDIAKNGLRIPIVIDADDKILDGRNRAAACAIAGVEPVFEPFVGNDEEKLAFVVSANIHRRHLTTSQRASVAAKLLPLYEEQAAKRVKATQAKPGMKVGKAVENLPQPSTADLWAADQSRKEAGKARDKAGAAMNVSGKAVDMAAKVHAKAIPEISEAVDRGEIAVSAAAIVADMPHEQQRAIASEGPKAVREAAAKVRKAEPKRQESAPYVAEYEAEDEPPDIAELFAGVKDEFRVLLIEIPAKHRRSVMRQVYEQLSQEEVELW
jgi:ParB-like chromosome segregation protein Spo0J